MSLINIENASLSYGLLNLLDGVELNVERGSRVCLIGRNGAGKSSLMKVLAGEIDLDDGVCRVEPGAVVARLEQDLPEPNGACVYDVVAGGLASVGQLLAQYHHLSLEQGADLNRLAQLQQQIEASDGWLLQQRVESIISRLQLPADKTMGELSGGWRRRVSLAKALVQEPDVLLLDEPTNHLDVEAIEWLENQLLEYRGALVFITHDRALLQKLANEIVELDRGHLRHWKGDYQSFLEFREQALAEEARHNALFDKRLAEEEAWIRQGIKARRTRNEGRVRALKAMRVERSERRERQGSAKFELNSGELSGKIVAEFERVNYSWESKPILRDFSMRIMRGDRIGFIGPNGVGKSTLLKLIVGDLEADSGTIRRGTKLEVAYFDQLRDQLDLEKTPVDNVSEGRDFIDINGKSRHIISYLADFLFTGDRARTPLKALSGGERNRVLLAKLFSKPANLLVLDEPTNDLDVETLELLEDILLNCESTLLLVSHDRAFLDNVVTSTVAFEAPGVVREYVGGYQDWLRQRPAKVVDGGGREEKKTPSKSVQVSPAAAKPQKLSYKLQRELDQLPAKMEALEAQIEQLQRRIAEPDFFSGDSAATAPVLQELADAEAELEACFERWAELEGEA